MSDAENLNVVALPRFGECTYLDSEVLQFPWGLPGFANLRSFLALQVDAADRFTWLQSLDDLSVAIPMGDPWSVFEDYAPELPQYARAALGLDTVDEFAIQCVVVASKDASEFSMNLLAPIVINLQTRTGRQIALEGSPYSVRTPIPRKKPDSPLELADAAQEEAISS